ncbi:MAG: dTDP-4-dehydrorhamnose reductase [Anaerolineae bacterium]|nr:dTDP-4-dehydrorhamnose reductase [Anaerolineae bacterium]NUQ03282.1 dTDP-4-dehydrorhamnose reductase [Anaerolineae bacterium]
MRIIVTGAAGRLGGALKQRLGDHDVIGVDVADFDVADFAAVRAFVDAAKPDLLLHCAAWTDVDGCARDPERAIRINGFGAGNLAQAAARVGAAVLYISSNEVFDGKAARPYHEYDAAAPVNAYGYSKWIGEQETARATPRHYIVRTSWLFAHGGRNFIQTIMNAAREGRTLRVVTDEIACPTYNDDLADAIARLIGTERYGVYHLVGEGVCSRFEFAQHILRRSGLTAEIHAIRSAEWDRASTPPAYTPLRNLAGAALGIVLPEWRLAVDTFLRREGALVESP